MTASAVAMVHGDFAAIPFSVRSRKANGRSRPRRRRATFARMDKRDFGGVAVPVYGQGTWTFHGGPEALRAGLDLGLTHIDTAELYTGAEEIVGQAIEGRRDEVFLVSKVMPQNASRRGAVKACETS